MGTVTTATTRPSRGPSPVSLAPRIHPRLSYWSVSLTDRMDVVMALENFLPGPFTHCNHLITNWPLRLAYHARWSLARLRSMPFSARPHRAAGAPGSEHKQ